MGMLHRIIKAIRGEDDRTQAASKASPMSRAVAMGSTSTYPMTSAWEELNHFTSWNYVGIHAVAKNFSAATVTVYDKSEESKQVQKSIAPDAPNEQRTPIPQHDIAKLMKRPNPMKSGRSFMYLIACHMRLTGGYAIYEVRNREGKPVELWPIPRAWMTWQPGSEQHPLGLWRVMPPRGAWGFIGNNELRGGFFLDYRDVIIGGWPNPLYPGEHTSPLSACAQIIDIMEKTDMAVWSALMNAPRPGMILSIDANVTDEQFEQMEEHIRAEKSGVHNAGKTTLLTGAHIEKTGTDVGDLDAVNVRNQSKDFTLGIQGVPSVVTGIRSEVGSYAGDAASYNAFAELNIQPDLDLFAADLTHRWQRIYGDDFEIELSAKRYDDPVLEMRRADQLAGLCEKGIVTKNQVLAAMKLPPIEGGDVLKEPPAPPMMPGMGGAMPGQEQPPPGDPAAQEAIPDEQQPQDEDESGIGVPELEQPVNRVKTYMNGVH